MTCTSLYLDADYSRGLSFPELVWKYGNVIITRIWRPKWQWVPGTRALHCQKVFPNHMCRWMTSLSKSRSATSGDQELMRVYGSLTRALGKVLRGELEVAQIDEGSSSSKKKKKRYLLHQQRNGVNDQRSWRRWRREQWCRNCKQWSFCGN